MLKMMPNILKENVVEKYEETGVDWASIVCFGVYI
jgi:hypothetical protein